MGLGEPQSLWSKSTRAELEHFVDYYLGENCQWTTMQAMSNIPALYTGQWTPQLFNWQTFWNNWHTGTTWDSHNTHVLPFRHRHCHNPLSEKPCRWKKMELCCTRLARRHSCGRGCADTCRCFTFFCSHMTRIPQGHGSGYSSWGARWGDARCKDEEPWPLPVPRGPFYANVSVRSFPRDAL